MAGNKSKLSPVEREINTRRRRIENARKRIAKIQCDAVNQVHEINANMECDQAVLNALLAKTKKR